MAFKLKNNLLLVLLISIIVLGLILRFIYSCGLCNPDSFAYINGAIRMNDDGVKDYLATIANIYENRISIILPLAFVFKLFGLSEFSTMLLPLFYAIGTILITYLLGKQLFNQTISLLAAFIVAIIPLEIFYSTAILPDAIIPFYAGLTLLCFLLGQKKDNNLFYLLAGFFLFCAFEARATSGVLIVPLLLLAWWSEKRNMWDLLLPAGAFVTCIVIYWGILFLITGNFFAQVDLFAQDATMENYVGTGEFLGHFKNSFKLSGEFGLLYVMAFPSLIVGLYKALHNESYRLPTLTFLIIYLFFEFGSTTLTNYEPIWKLSRFLTILSIPASLLVAAVVVFLFTNTHRWLRLAIFAFMTLHMIFVVALPIYNSKLTHLIVDYNDPFKSVFAQLATYDDIELIHIVHYHWSLRGQFYARLHNKIYQYQDLKNQSTAEMKEGDVVVYDPLFFTSFGERYLDASQFPITRLLPETPPDNWHLLFMVDRIHFPDFPVSVYLVEG